MDLKISIYMINKLFLLILPIAHYWHYFVKSSSLEALFRQA